MMSQKKCPNCGTEYQPGKKFCRECGTALPTPSAGLYCPKCDIDYEEGKKFCRECGSPLVAKGVSVAAPPPTGPPPSPPPAPVPPVVEKAVPAAAPKRKFGLPLVGAVAVLLLLAVVGGVLLLRGRGAPATETPTARAASVIAMPTETEPTVIGDGRIVFTSERDGNGEIYVMNADGSGLTRLTNNPARDIEPSWSPDGRRIT